LPYLRWLKKIIHLPAYNNYYLHELKSESTIVLQHKINTCTTKHTASTTQMARPLATRGNAATILLNYDTWWWCGRSCGYTDTVVADLRGTKISRKIRLYREDAASGGTIETSSGHRPGLIFRWSLWILINVMMDALPTTTNAQLDALGSLSPCGSYMLGSRLLAVAELPIRHTGAAAPAKRSCTPSSAHGV
jgi:hypothetical protein